MSKLRYLFDRLLLIPALILVMGPVQTAAAAVIGDFYVSGLGDDMTGDGSEPNPWRTITHAVAQAGGGAPTIMIGAGNYDQSLGESYPIYIDEHDVAGITISGPGDGSAVIGQGFCVAPCGGIAEDLFAAQNYVSGEIVISGLDFEGTTQAVLNLDDGAASLRMEWNNVGGIGLLDVDYTPYGGDYVISNNSIADAHDVIRMTFASPYTNSETVSANLTVQNNTFTDCGDVISYTVYLSSDLWMDVNVLIEGNTFEDCTTAIYEQGSATEEAHYNVNTVINDNTITSCEYPIYFSFEASYTAVINRNIEITNNNIVGSSSGIYFTTSIDEHLDYNETVLIEGNSIEGVYTGIYQSFEKDYTGSYVDRDWRILGNTIEGCSGNAVALYAEFSWESSTETDGYEYDLLVDGNTFRGNGGGLDVSHEVSYGTGESSLNYVITRNNISNNADGGIYLYVEASTGDIDHSVVIRGNVLEGNDPGGGQIVMFASDLMDTDGSYDLDFDMGHPNAFGYNTIVADGDNPSSWSVSFFQVVSGNSVVTADLNAVGNWWGTQDAGVIEDRVYHGPDSSGSFTANLSNPLADALTYSISQPGNKVRLTAGDGSGFVPYAGDLDIAVTVDGVAAENVTVADDYGSLTFTNSYGGQEVEICVTNPGGQSGCMTATIAAVKSSGGGCGVIPVSGGMPTAKHLIEQYLLMLLPVLFFFRRRSRGQAATPAGFTAA